MNDEIKNDSLMTVLYLKGNVYALNKRVIGLKLQEAKNREGIAVFKLLYVLQG